FQEWLVRRYCCNRFALFTVGRRRRRGFSKDPCVFPLLGQALRINVWIPNHQRGHKRVRHSAASQHRARETFVTYIRLANEDAVVTFCERSATPRRFGRCVSTERDVFRTCTGACLQSKTEEPIIEKCSAQTQAKTVTFALALLPIIWMSRIVVGKSAAAVLISQPHITEEFQFSDRWKQFPFGAAQIRNKFLDVRLSVISELGLCSGSGNDGGCTLSVFFQTADFSLQLRILFFQQLHGALELFDARGVGRRFRAQ